MRTDIETLAKWSEPKRVETKLGPRLLRTAEPTDAFSAAWKSGKDALKAAGLSWSQDKQTGVWKVCWWMPLPKEETERMARAVEASKATSADVRIPAPDGLDYLPFQKAGIAFMLEKFGFDNQTLKGVAKPISQLAGVLLADEMG